MRPDVVEAGRARLIANGEGYGESFRKLTDGFRAAAEDRAVLIIDALQMFEKLSGIHLAGNAEADAIGERTIGCKKNAAVVVPDGLAAFCLAERRARSATEKNQECEASDFVVQETHEWRPCPRKFTPCGKRQEEK